MGGDGLEYLLGALGVYVGCKLPHALIRKSQERRIHELEQRVNYLEKQQKS